MLVRFVKKFIDVLLIFPQSTSAHPDCDCTFRYVTPNDVWTWTTTASHQLHIEALVEALIVEASIDSTFQLNRMIA